MRTAHNFTRVILAAIAAMTISTVSFRANAQIVHSVTANPGENSESAINISWNSDIQGTYVVYSPAEGGKGKGPFTAVPETEFMCLTYDGLPSRDAAGVNFDQDVKFYKCGASLTSLKKNTEYIYYICSKDGERLCANHRFKTSGARNWSAIVISDYHSYTPLPARLAGAMAMTRKVEAFDGSSDWVLHLGDICAWGGSYDFWKTMYKEDLFSKYFVAGVNGNHDNMTRTNGQSGDFFKNANYFPRNGYGDQMGICYHFRYSDALFIMLNNEAMRPQEGFEEAQAWVRKVITEQKASANPPKYIIVCEHYQWFFGKDGSFSHFTRWHDLFDEMGVDLALGGNNHIYVRSHPIKDSKVTDPKHGTVYIQTSSSDNERGETMNETLSENADLIAARWTEGGKTVSAISLQVTPRKMKLTLLDRTGKVIDRAVIPAKH